MECNCKREQQQQQQKKSRLLPFFCHVFVLPKKKLQEAEKHRKKRHYNHYNYERRRVFFISCLIHYRITIAYSLPKPLRMIEHLSRELSIREHNQPEKIVAEMVNVDLSPFNAS